MAVLKLYSCERNLYNKARCENLGQGKAVLDVSFVAILTAVLKYRNKVLQFKMWACHCITRHVKEHSAVVAERISAEEDLLPLNAKI